MHIYCNKSTKRALKKCIFNFVRSPNYFSKSIGECTCLSLISFITKCRISPKNVGCHGVTPDITISTTSDILFPVSCDAIISGVHCTSKTIFLNNCNKIFIKLWHNSVTIYKSIFFITTEFIDISLFLLNIGRLKLSRSSLI